MCLYYNEAETARVRSILESGQGETLGLFKIYEITYDGKVVSAAMQKTVEPDSDGYIHSDREGVELNDHERQYNLVDRGIHTFLQTHPVAADLNQFKIPVQGNIEDFVGAGGGHVVFTKVKVDLEKFNEAAELAKKNYTEDDDDVDDDDEEDDDDDYDDDDYDDEDYDEDDDDDDDDDDDWDDDDDDDDDLDDEDD